MSTAVDYSPKNLDFGLDFGLAVGATVVGNLFSGSSSNDGDKNKGNDGNTATGTGP